MDKTSFMILLVTGFSTTSESAAYYFYSNVKNWNAALSYCQKTHLNLLQDFDSFNSNSIPPTSLMVNDSKAWIGVHKTSSIRLWVDGGGEIYNDWSPGEPSGGMTGLCVSMSVEGWHENNCSDLRPSVCSNGAYFIIETEMSWNDALTNCKKEHSLLVSIPDNETNAEIMNLLPNNTQAWIGLYKEVLWYTTTGFITRANWAKGQPDNSNNNEHCAAMTMLDGTWTAEPCGDLYPFICRDVDKSKKIIVKLKIQTMANLEDLVATASLTQQLETILSKRGVNDIKLFWKKLPVKESDQKGDP